MAWKDLSMSQRAEVIGMAVKSGLRDMDSIRKLYDESIKGSRRFENGGLKKQPAAVTKKNRFADMSIEELKAIEKANEEYWRKQQEELDNRTPEQIRQMGIEADKKYRQKYPNGREADPNLQRAAGVVMSALSDAANSIPFIGSEVAEAAEEQRQEKLDKWRDYKKGINATITAAELGLSGASLLGAYANWKNWATAANATKRSIANLLQKAQLPMQVGGTSIDAYQTYDALQNNDNFNANYNGISTGLGIAGSVGASDIFLNSRLHSPKIDRVLDVLGIIQNSGDFIKFGYDSIFGNKKVEGGSIHIDPSKKGTFTAAASRHGKSVQEFASQVLSHPENYSLTMRKKANFARNANKWKH